MSTAFSLSRTLRVAPLALAFLATAPSGVAQFQRFAPDHVLIADNSGQVSEYDAARNLVSQTTFADGADALRGPAIGPDGFLYACDWTGGEVVAYDALGAVVKTFDADGQLLNPGGCTFGPEGLLYVSDPSTPTVWVLDADDTVVRQIGSDAEFTTPDGLCFGTDGRLYVTDYAGPSVEVFDRTGLHLHSITSPQFNPLTMLVHPSGDLLVLTLNSVVHLDSDGNSLGTFYGTGGLDMTWGPDGNIWIAAGANNTAHVVDTEGNLVDTLTDVGPFVMGAVTTPRRFRAKVRGYGGLADEALTRQKDAAAIVSLWSASGEVAIDWDDDGDLATLFGANAWVLPGFTQLDANSEKKRLWSAAQVGINLDGGTTSATLLMRGVPQDDGTWLVKKAAGVLQRSAKSGSAHARITTAGPAKE